MLELLFKDFAIQRAENKGRKGWIRAILAIVGAGLLIALICYLTISLDGKITQYAKDDSSVNLSFLIFFVFLTFIVQTIEGMVRARKLLFNERDYQVLRPLCSSVDEIVTSKMVHVYIYQVLEAFCMATPMLITYGAIRIFIPYYYVFCCVYPLFISLVSTGLSFVFVFLFQVGHKFLKNKEILQFILASGLVIGLCYIYQYFLNFFLQALSDSSFGEMFSADFIGWVRTASSYLVPVYHIISSVVNVQSIPSALAILFGIAAVSLTLGYFVAYFSYLPLNRKDGKSVKSSDGNIRPVLSVRKALFKKEMDVLFRNSGNTFSYTALLIMLPFLSFVVLSSINTILQSNLRLIIAYFPDLMSFIQLLIVLEFLLVIHSNSSSAFSSEGKNLLNVKLLPVNPWTIIMAKVLIPMAFTSFSFLITVFVLVLTGNISWEMFGFVTSIGLLLIAFTDLGGVLCDMRDLSGNGKSSALFGAFTLLYPVILVAMDAAFEFTLFKGTPIMLVNLGVTVLLTGVSIWLFFAKSTKYFKKMEVRSV